MLEAILTHLHNWFPAKDGKHAGAFVIASGVLSPEIGLVSGQYYRIRGSVFNDGLHRVDDGELLTDETFDGEVWALAIPHAVQVLAEEIDAWREKNPETDKVSESFGGYSYSRGQNASGGAGGWQSAFAGRLNSWRRPNDD